MPTWDCHPRCCCWVRPREFGDVEETGILINLDEIADEKKRRHIDSYLENIER